VIHLPPYLIYLGYLAARSYLRKHGSAEPLKDVRTEPGATGQGGPGLNQQRLKDLGLLGLDEGATQKAIEEAFRRLARVHHPDRFCGQPEDAVEAARKSFLLLRAAYDRLQGGAA